jgi:hypothetical protein
MDEPGIALADKPQQPLQVMADTNDLIAGVLFPQ